MNYKKTILFFLFSYLSISMNAQNKYAVLITGDYRHDVKIPLEQQWNEGIMSDSIGNLEFWHDTYLMWELLQNKGFERENIFVCFADGADYTSINPRYQPPLNISVTDYPADFNHIKSVFEGLHNGVGFPKVTEDDFLFVWTFSHGSHELDGHYSLFLLDFDVLRDDTLSSWVNNIPAHKKAFWMQQCHGGGFASALQANNVVFNSACQSYELAHPADDYTIDSVFFIENDTLLSNTDKYVHGEFDYHLFSVCNGSTPSGQFIYDEDTLANGDLNHDNIISLYEASLWELSHESIDVDRGDTPCYSDMGGIGYYSSFEYPTLLFDSIVNNETHRGIVGISKDLVVANGQTLTFTGKSDVTLCDSVTLVIEEGATLVIDGKVNFNGTTNNLLVIHGSLIQNNGSSLSFSNMQVFSDATELSVTGASFNNTELKYKPLGSSAIAESTVLSGNALVRNCRFHNPSKRNAIFIENCRDFDIDGDTVTACLGTGIYIKNSGNVTSGPLYSRRVRNNAISGCSNAGLIFYASTGHIYMNNIYGNGVGVKLLNKSNVLSFNGDCEALSEMQTQYIHDNNSYEIYMTSNCNPQVMQYNSIHKTNSGSTPFVYYDNNATFVDPNPNPGGKGIINVSNNEWGNNFYPATHLYSTTPSMIFNCLPYWGFNDCPGWPSDGRLLSIADSLCDAGAYEAAKSVYHQVIEGFPNTVSAETALKALLPLECLVNANYENLKHYYLTDTIIVSRENLSYLSNHLANRCDEILANYDEAIAWYEGVITNPETTFADSIFATIDLGNLYLEMEGNGIKAAGKLMQLRPKSRCAYEWQCEYALSLLPELSENDYLLTSLREDPYPLWTDTIVSQPEGYTVDAEGNVEISSSDGLVWLISTVNGLNGCDPDDFEGRTVRLANDIDFGEEGWSFCFSPIGTRETPFMGTFDGDGHKIHHLRQRYSLYDGVNNYYFDMGVFGYIRHAIVKNVTLDSTCRLSSTCDYPGYYRGCMVGFADSLSVVDDIYIHAPIAFQYGSSLVGMNRNSTVRNCACGGRDYEFGSPHEGAALVAYNRCEGGFADAVVENCYFYGRLGVSYSSYYQGGLVCFNQSVPNNNGKRAIIRNCHCTPTHDFMGFRAYGTFAAVLSSESSIRYCYYDPTKMYQYAQMVGLNEGGELYYCSEYTNIDGIGILALPVAINDTLTDNLLDALNLWIANQEHPELYRTWTIINDSIPVFGDYYVGVPENQDSNDWVTVHPNPTSGFVSVNGKNLRQAEVVNMLGQQVMRVESEGNGFHIDIAALPAGIYFVSVIDKDGRRSVHKVMKE